MNKSKQLYAEIYQTEKINTRKSLNRGRRKDKFLSNTTVLLRRLRRIIHRNRVVYFPGRFGDHHTWRFHELLRWNIRRHRIKTQNVVDRFDFANRRLIMYCFARCRIFWPADFFNFVGESFWVPRRHGAHSAFLVTALYDVVLFSRTLISCYWLGFGMTWRLLRR